MMKHVGLVACVKTKLPHRAATQDLYISALFRFSRSYVQARCDEWAVLSAKHGLLLPGKVIEPYDETLVGKPKAALQEWGRRTWTAISTRWDPTKTTFVFLGGQAYAAALVDALHVERPLGRLKMGPRLSFLKNATRAKS
jgi:hypothetical protein